ncbi:MAG: hypothetical protein E7403_04520 [Ruminococcaceae bacterium]|nr:hypothetical protein [Oscillospiraceae bacterium]
MFILAPKTEEQAYRKAVQVFQEYYQKITGIALDIKPEPSATEDMVIIGSEVVQPYVFENLRGGLPVRYQSDEFCMISKEDKGRTLLYLAGGRGRSTLYAVYDFFERRGGCHYFWDGDVIPEGKTIDITGLNVYEVPRFQYRAIRYFAHRGLSRFQAEHWDFDQWQREIDWLLKSRLNVFMLRIGIDDLFQKAFPDIVSYPSNEEVLPEATEGFNNRTTFWPLQYRGELRKKVLDYAFSCDLIHPEDCGTMTHWYSRTPKEFLEKVNPGFLSQTSKSQSEQTGLVWDIFDEENLKNYQKLTDTHVKEYGKAELFHTIGLAERTYNEDRQKNLDLKKYAYRKIIDHVSKNYPNAPMLIAAWDFFFCMKPEEVREMVKMFDPEKTIIFDYTVDLKEEHNNFEEWDIMGKIPWIFGIFHAYEPQNHIHGDYEYITKKLEKAASDSFCKGLAFWPENSHSDTLMLEYFRENAWKPQGRSVDKIAKDMCFKRYGEDGETMLKIWQAFLPILKLPTKSGIAYFHDILKPNAGFLRLFELDYERHSDYVDWLAGLEDYDLQFTDTIKELLTLVHNLPEEVYEKPFIRRDVADLLKTVVMKKLQYRFMKLSYLLMRWYQGIDEAENIRVLLEKNEKMLDVMGDVLGLHEDNSLYYSLLDLQKNRPINPHFEDALKDNVVNWYCRSNVYEALQFVYKKEVQFFKNWVLEQLLNNDRTRNVECFAKAKEQIFEEFKKIPLKDFHQGKKPDYKTVTAAMLAMME